MLVVPESRDRPGGRLLRLAVARIAARRPEPAADPLLLLHGGPGGQLVANAPALAASPLGEDRELLLFDQRGTGHSRPALCPDLARRDLQPLAADLSPAEEVAQRLELQLACRDALVEQGVDLSAYHSDASAADAEALRRVLGIERWNLFGVSYGTKLALTILDEFPEAVRSVILDSAYPPGLLSDTRTRDFARALDALAEGCAADPGCRGRWPDLRAEIAEAVRGLRAEPLAVPVPEGSPVEGDRYVINAQDLWITLHQTLYDDDIIPAIPFLVSAVRDRDAEALRGLVDAMGERAIRVNRAVYAAVECTERLPFWNERPSAPVPEPWRELLRDFVYFEVDRPLCAAWSPHRAGPEELEPVQSEVPALVLAGEYDPITPPAFGRFASYTLARSTFALLPSVGHGAVRSHPCGEKIALDFLRDPESPPALGCTESIEPIRFVTDVHVHAGVYRLARALFLRPDPALRGALAGLVLALAAPPLLWGASASLRRGRAAPHPIARGARLAAGLACVAALLFLLGLLGAMARVAGERPILLVFGLPDGAAPLFVLPWVASALGLLALGAAPPAWRRIPGAGGRALLALALLVCAGSALFAWSYGFL